MIYRIDILSGLVVSKKQPELYNEPGLDCICA
jgi:hypothetical protein